MGCSPIQLAEPWVVDDDAVQVSVSSDDHAKVSESWGETVRELVAVPVIDVEMAGFEVELALKVILGRRGTATATTACCMALLPPGPLQDTEYVVLRFSFINVALPDRV